MGNGNSFSDKGYDAFQNQAQSVQGYNEQRFQSLNNELVQVHKRNAELAARITQLEKHIHYPHSLGQEVAVKEAAVRAEAVPMRSDVETILTLRAFVGSIATGGDLENYVPARINHLADEALARKK
jgi:hypothetical protein